MQYWVLFSKSYDDGAVLSTVPGDGPKSYKYKKGIPLKADFPQLEDAIMCFDPNFPDRLKLYDIQKCLGEILVINSKTKGFFEKHGINEEFLPVRLWDHEENTVSDDYFIFNCQETADIFDMEKSELIFDEFFPDRILYVNNMVINPELKTDAKIFRASTMKNQLFISDDFKIALENADIEGYKVFPAEGWDGLDL